MFSPCLASHWVRNIFILNEGKGQQVRLAGQRTLVDASVVEREEIKQWTGRFSPKDQSMAVPRELEQSEEGGYTSRSGSICCGARRQHHWGIQQSGVECYLFNIELDLTI